ncbi:hypothetical protein [Azospirillum picis]|uniref:Uncharacterized protein n=1 Tax=Azospirillum picis TaxID=488438 RepID=A0ABU0MTF1_9PROT|nr:hypothetical protein [Azospirillum picis]MBP2303019.1 hypothetical protein [Azospirillum picis]MDQ0536771.1 hypothetical protein [Azospirillum picis]
MKAVDVNHVSTGLAVVSLHRGIVIGTGRFVMADQLKSFRKDWQRWSSTEKLVAVTVILAIAALLGAPAAANMF